MKPKPHRPCPGCNRAQLWRSQKLCPECRTKHDEAKRLAALVTPPPGPYSETAQRIESALAEAEAAAKRIEAILTRGERQAA